MPKTVAIGIQSFAEIREKNYFYVDKTAFIKEWWEKGDTITLIARPHRFGKTLNMSMLEQFFSVKYEGQDDLFAGLAIWNEEKYRTLQGTYPVIRLSFANINEESYEKARLKIAQVLLELHDEYKELLKNERIDTTEYEYIRYVSNAMDEVDISYVLYRFSELLYKHFAKKVIILLDGYDVPIQKAYMCGYHKKLLYLLRSLFLTTFKTNPYLERAIILGEMEINKFPILADEVNLNEISMTSDNYATSFGFTEEEVLYALRENNLIEESANVKEWYGSFAFGKHNDIYNPWSVLNFLNVGKSGIYWTDVRSDNLINKLLREGNRSFKISFETLLYGETIKIKIDSQISYNHLLGNEKAVWSYLLAGGYVKVLSYEKNKEIEAEFCRIYEIGFTNLEVRRIFEKMVTGWFDRTADTM